MVPNITTTITQRVEIDMPLTADEISPQTLRQLVDNAQREAWSLLPGVLAPKAHIELFLACDGAQRAKVARLLGFVYAKDFGVHHARTDFGAWENIRFTWAH